MSAITALGMVALQRGQHNAKEELKKVQDKQETVNKKTEETNEQLKPSNGHTVAQIVESLGLHIKSMELNLGNDIRRLNDDLRDTRRDMYGLGVALGQHIWGHQPDDHIHLQPPDYPDRRDHERRGTRDSDYQGPERRERPWFAPPPDYEHRRGNEPRS